MAARRMVTPSIDDVSGVDHGANLVDGWMVIKAAGEVSPEIADVLMRAEAIAKGIDLSTIATNRPTKGSDMTDTLNKSAEELDAEAFAKAVESLPDAFRKGIMGLQRRAANAESLAKSLLNERETDRFEGIAKELTHLPGQDESFAKALRDVHDADPDAFDVLLKTLRSADAMAKESGLFEEFGASGQGAADAEGGLMAFAKELMTKNPDMTEPEAVEKAASMHPDLYATHRRETLRANATQEA